MQIQQHHFFSGFVFVGFGYRPTTFIDFARWPTDDQPCCEMRIWVGQNTKLIFILFCSHAWELWISAYRRHAIMKSENKV